MEMLSKQRTIDQYVFLVVSVSFSQMLSISGFLNLQKKCKITNHVQIGFSENHRTTNHIFTLKSIISMNVSNSTRGKVYSCFVDFKKAFDTVWHEGLFQKLLEVNIKGNFLKLIQSLYKKSTCAVKINNCRTDFFS